MHPALAGAAFGVAFRIDSRALWTGAAVLLGAAAVKLVRLDFGALGEVANSVALIAAGPVFLGGAGFAPFPPARQVGPAGAAGYRQDVSSERGSGASESSVT